MAQWTLKKDTLSTGPVTIDIIDTKQSLPVKDGYPDRDDSHSPKP